MCQPNSIPNENVLGNNGEINIFQDKQKLKKFIAGRPTLIKNY